MSAKKRDVYAGRSSREEGGAICELKIQRSETNGFKKQKRNFLEAGQGLKVMNLSKLVKFSGYEGALNSVEGRKRVKKDLLKTKNYNVVLVGLKRGQEIPERTEPYDVCFYVVEGCGTFRVGGKQANLSRGEMVFAPANVARGMKSKERLIVLGIQAPH
jgi:quercetin dioxygenase-like cupin family protein